MTPPGGHGPVIWWGGWGRGRRKPETGAANSGLTGDPTLEPPQPPEGPKDLRGRWESLKQSVAGTTSALPQVLRLVWEASHPTTISLFMTTALAGLVPVISAGISMMLINSVVQGLTITVTHRADRIHLNSLGVPWLPDLVYTSVGMIVFIAVLQLVVFAFSSLLAALSLVSPVPAFIADTRYGWRGYNIARWGSRLLRRMNYMVTLVTTDSFAKEVKLFGLGGYFIERYRLIASAFYSSQRAQLVRRYMTGFALGNISTIVTTVTYVYVALLPIAGRRTIGHLSFFTHAASPVQNSIQSFLSGVSGIYEHNLYLNNLYELMAKEPSIKLPGQPTPVPPNLRAQTPF